MKLNVIPTIIAVAISALIAFGLYSFAKTEDYQSHLAIASFIALLFPLATTLGAKFEEPRTSANVKTLSGVFFILALIASVLFAFVKFTVPVLVLSEGLILLVWLLVAYAVAKAKQ